MLDKLSEWKKNKIKTSILWVLICTWKGGVEARVSDAFRLSHWTFLFHSIVLGLLKVTLCPVYVCSGVVLVNQLFTWLDSIPAINLECFHLSWLQHQQLQQQCLVPYWKKGYTAAQYLRPFLPSAAIKQIGKWVNVFQVLWELLPWNLFPITSEISS